MRRGLLAPRAREESMRPHRLFGVGARPLNFTVRRRNDGSSHATCIDASGERRYFSADGFFASIYHFLGDELRGLDGRVDHLCPLPVLGRGSTLRCYILVRGDTSAAEAAAKSALST